MFKIDTPVGGFEPDFIYERSGTVTRGLLEIKGDFLWSGPDSKDQRKARAACAWTTAVNAAARDHGDVPWEFAVVLAEDVPTAAHLDGLRAIARTRAP